LPYRRERGVSRPVDAPPGLRFGRGRLGQPVAVGVDKQGQAAGDLQLAKDGGEVIAQGVPADMPPLGDLFAGGRGIPGVRGSTDYRDTAQMASAIGTISMEWKAPPAFANEYINDTQNYRDNASGGVRGCIISQIAHHHAKEEKYGPKGGDGDL
jgi:hypothetical protein